MGWGSTQDVLRPDIPGNPGVELSLDDGGCDAGGVWVERSGGGGVQPCLGTSGIPSGSRPGSGAAALSTRTWDVRGPAREAEAAAVWPGRIAGPEDLAGGLCDGPSSSSEARGGMLVLPSSGTMVVPLIESDTLVGLLVMGESTPVMGESTHAKSGVWGQERMG